MKGKTQHMNPNPTRKLLGKLPNSSAGICHPRNRAICLQCLISQQRLTSEPVSACSNPTHSPLNISEQESVRSGIVFGLFLKHRRDGLWGGRSWGCPSLTASPRSLGEASQEKIKTKQPKQQNPTNNQKTTGFRSGMKAARSCHHACLNGTVRKVPT